MKPNAYLQKLGYSETDRLLIVHTDDIGMCHASVQAFQDLWRFGTIMSPLFIQSYIQAASSRLLPSMLPRLDAKGIEIVGMGEQERQMYMPIMQMLETMGLPMLDGLLSMPLNEPSDPAQMEIAKELFGDLPEGITHFILHPAIDTPELRAIAPDWESRAANYNVFLSDELKRLLEREDLKLIGYRHIRTAMRNG